MRPIRKGIPFGYPDYCHHCNQAMAQGSGQRHEGKILCPDCYQEETGCHGCGAELPEEWGGYCPTCS